MGEPPEKPPLNQAVFSPPCRSGWDLAWDLVNRVLAGDWRRIWQAVVLLATIGAVTAGVLVAGSVPLRAAALSAAGLYVLLQLGAHGRPPERRV
ncbi:hypothetical protein AB5J62_15210 [Amycolatopsis sp. cg5]|uniref:hypothetical protein n=1 Tax=Amycolatopsis sp. cg5 TaxID=3238802 RepID=UPI0035255C47